MRLLILFIGLIGCLCAAEKPNVVYILADDLGYGDVRATNSGSKIATPGLDRMAAEGMVFTDAHSGSSVCTPTRYGVLTGRYAFRSRMKKGVLSGYSKHLIEESRLTVGKMLQQEGYHTAFIGKWHLGWDWAGGDKPKTVNFSEEVTNGPRERGFTYSFGHSGSLDMPPYVWVENGRVTALPNREAGVTKKHSKNGWYRTGDTGSDFKHEEVLPEFTERAVRYIEERGKNKDEPFFLYLPLASPHTPVLVTEEFRGKSGLKSDYADFVTMTDYVVVRVLEALKKNGLDENTMVIFTSDNGCSPEADFPELLEQGHDANGGLRGHKADIFEGGHRVPFLVRWPEKVKGGEICREVICLTDLMATMGEVVGVKIPEGAGEDSVSFLGHLTGKAKGALREATVHHSVNGTFAVRVGKWKLIDAPHSGGWSHPRPRDKASWKDLPKVQLYDLEADLGEKKNLAEEKPEVVERLRAVLERVKKGGVSNEANEANGAEGARKTFKEKAAAEIEALKGNERFRPFEFDVVEAKPFLILITRDEGSDPSVSDEWKNHLVPLAKGIWRNWLGTHRSWELKSERNDTLEDPDPFVWLAFHDKKTFDKYMDQNHPKRSPGARARYDGNYVIFRHNAKRDPSIIVIHETLHQLMDRYSRLSSARYGNHCFTEGIPEYFAGYKGEGESLKLGELTRTRRMKQLQKMHANFDKNHKICYPHAQRGRYQISSDDWLFFDVPMLLTLRDQAWTRGLCRAIAEQFKRSPYYQDDYCKDYIGRGELPFHSAFYALSWAFTTWLKDHYPEEYRHYAKVVMNTQRGGDAEVFLEAFGIEPFEPLPDMKVLVGPNNRDLAKNQRAAVACLDQRITILRRTEKIQKMHREWARWMAKTFPKLPKEIEKDSKEKVSQE